MERKRGEEDERGRERTGGRALSPSIIRIGRPVSVSGSFRSRRVSEATESLSSRFQLCTPSLAPSGFRGFSHSKSHRRPSMRTRDRRFGRPRTIGRSSIVLAACSRRHRLKETSRRQTKGRGSARRCVASKTGEAGRPRGEAGREANEANGVRLHIIATRPERFRHCISYTLQLMRVKPTAG